MSGKTKQWAVRGIPVDLVDRVGTAAKAEGMKLGRWVSLALEDALERDTVSGRADRETDLEERVQVLEAAVQELQRRLSQPPSSP